MQRILRFNFVQSHPMLQLHLGVALLGVSGLFAKLITLSALDIIAYRSLVTAIVLGLFILYTSSAIRLRSKKDYLTAGVLGLLAAIHWLTYFAAIQKTSVAVGMIVLFTYPVMTVLLDPLLDKRLPAVKDILISITVLFGVSLLFPNLWPGENAIDSDYILGIALGLLSALTFALRNIGIQRHFKGYSGTQSMFYQFAISALLFLPFTDAHWFDLTLHDLQLLIVFAIFFSAMAHVLFSASIVATSAKTAGLVACLQPLYGIVLSLILLSEVPSFTTLIGGAIILTAAFYETSHAGKKLKKS